MLVNEYTNTMFKQAIVRTPCQSMIYGLTNADLGLPDYRKALVQHADYIEALEKCGLNVMVLEADERFPDSTFVEDVALCTPEMALITNPGAPSRIGETVEMKNVLEGYYNTIEEIRFPGTLDAGDVMMVGNHFYIGLSQRTNHQGADQLIEILNRHRMTGSTVPLKNMLHLKTGVAYLEQNTLLITEEFMNTPEFVPFKKIIVPGHEAYAANSVWVNGKILVPAGFPETKKNIETAGYQTISIDVSEFQKLDGGLSCLSLRF
jgi:dimethylargininase